MASATSAEYLIADDSAPTSLIDTHLHCFAGTRDAHFPCHQRAAYRPDQPATPEHLLDGMQAAGVDYAIVVHLESYQDDHRYLQHSLDIGGDRLKGTILLFSDRGEGSLAPVPELCERMNLVNARVHAYAPDRLPPFGQPELRRLWRMAGENNPMHG